MSAVDTTYVVSARSEEVPHWLPCKAEHGATVFIPGGDRVSYRIEAGLQFHALRWLWSAFRLSFWMNTQKLNLFPHPQIRRNVT
jgi:hypothetical protein